MGTSLSSDCGWDGAYVTLRCLAPHFEASLDLAADVIHRRVPLVMGSRDNVARVERLHHSPDSVLDRNAPLFAARGLFRV